MEYAVMAAFGQFADNRSQIFRISGVAQQVAGDFHGFADAVSIPTDGISEPQFHLSGEGGDRERVLPGNKKFVSGDQIERPQGGSGGGGGKQAADSGEGEDAFSFALSEAEFLDILFDDLELPDLVKATLKDETASEFRRAGFSSDGSTPNLNVLRTMRTSMSRRLALRRPSRADLQKKEAELAELRENVGDLDGLKRQADLYLEIEKMKRLQRAIPFIDPIDVRFNRFEPKPVPRAKAVMFCLMDVSASMGEREKDLAKRFFILLHLFLQAQIRQASRSSSSAIPTRRAKSTKHEFFHGTEMGGTIVSSALEKDDRDPRGALSRRGLEHLLRASVRRRQFEQRHRRAASICCARKFCR